MAVNAQIYGAALNPIGDEVAAQAGNRPLDEVLESIERREILAALRLANNQRTQAARLLRISRSRLYRRMEALGIGTQPTVVGGTD